jgi:8-oxo-dGTP diphosphatase
MASVRRIGIAVVQQGDCFLVGTRPAGVSLAGCAEFPGGKCEPDELPGACAVRECFEETGLTVELVSQLATIPWSYPHGDVELHFWLCRCTGVERDASPPLPRKPFRWLLREQLHLESFPPANAAMIDQLLAGVAGDSAFWSVTVRFFAASRDAVGADAIQLSLPPGSLLSSVQSLVLERHSGLGKYAGSLLWAVDNQYVAGTAPLRDGSVIACFPPVSGG